MTEMKSAASYFNVLISMAILTSAPKFWPGIGPATAYILNHQ